MTSDRHNHSDTKQANCQIKYRLVHITCSDPTSRIPCLKKSVGTLPWLLTFMPVVLVAQHVKPEAHTLLFCAPHAGHLSWIK